MKQLFTIFILFVLLQWGCSGRKNDSGYRLKGLESFRIDKKIDIDYSDTIPDYWGGYSDDTTAIDYEKFIVLIDSADDIKLHTYRLIPPEYEKYHSEFLTVGKHILSIDSLLNGVYQTYLSFTNVYKFKWDNYDFVLLTANNRVYSMNSDSFSCLLIQMQNNRYVNAAFFRITIMILTFLATITGTVF